MNDEQHDTVAPDPLRVGIGGPVGSGKTALVDRLCKRLRGERNMAVVTNDIYTREDAEFLLRSEALEAERTANAQLEERVKAIREKQETIVADLEARVDDLTEALEARDKDLQRLRRVNTTLRDTAAQLREAHASGAADAHLLNKSMQTELEGLRAAMAVDSAEINEVMAALDAIVKEAENA